MKRATLENPPCFQIREKGFNSPRESPINSKNEKRFLTSWFKRGLRFILHAALSIAELSGLETSKICQVLRLRVLVQFNVA